VLGHPLTGEGYTPRRAGDYCAVRRAIAFTPE
jgi:hypothetical protein